MKRAFVLGGFLLASAGLWAQQTQQVQPSELRPTGSTALSAEPFMSFGRTQCDEGGNLYFRPVAASGRYRDSATVVRLNPKTEWPTLYELSSEVAAEVTPIEMAVTRSGHVWLLTQNRQSNEYVVVGFNSDGSMAGRIALKTPPGLLAKWFSVADDGIILIAGYYPDFAPKEVQGEWYLALFDQSGTLRKALKHGDLDAVDLDAASKGPVTGGVAAGNDGNFYVLQRNNILVVSEWGDVVRRESYLSPAQDAVAAGILFADGFLSLEFDHISQDRSVHQEFLVLYSGTGAVFSWDRLSAELAKSVPLCFEGRSGYLFEKVENHKLELLSVPLR